MKYEFEKLIDPNGEIYSSFRFDPEPPRDTPLWGVAYQIDNETGYVHLSCLPVVGEIKDYKYGGSEFFQYKKNTNELRKSGSVNYHSRFYADTYEEAVELYNSLVEDRIFKLRAMLEEAESHKIKKHLIRRNL